MTLRRLAPSIALIAAALVGSAAAAQAVRGTVVDAQSGAPVAGALVALVGPDGAVRGEVLSDGAGRYLVRAPSAGTYRLRAQRVGYRPTSSPAMELAEGQVAEYRLEASVQRVALPAITVSTTRRCTGQAAGAEEVSTLWEEARKALVSSTYTARQYPYRYAVQRRQRLLDAVSLVTRTESVQTTEGYRQTPFVSVPAAQLAARGYMQVAGDTVVFAAPDAVVLLSESFQQAHCFHAEPADREHPGMIGLAFDPASQSEPKVDVRGVLWLDAATAELRVLEYGYTSLPSSADSPNVGGRVEFRRLPNGAWIVSRWRIRMPTDGPVRPAAASTAHLPNVLDPRGPKALMEEMGEVLQIHDAAGAVVAMTAQSTLTGLVYDSTAGAPLAGARVYLAGTNTSATTDSAGRYTLRGLAEGVYSLAFSHPRLDSLRYAPEPVRLIVVPPQAAAQDLAIPPMAAVLTAACTSTDAGTANLGGVVSAGGRPVEGVVVRAQWQRPGASGDSARAVAATDDAGRYRFCGLPAVTPVRLTVLAGDAPAPTEVRLSAGVPLRQDLAVTIARPQGPAHIGGPAGEFTRARVTLHVLDAQTSQPIAGAAVRLGPGMPADTTDRRGYVTVANVIPGTYTLELTHATYGTARSRLAVPSAGPVQVELRIPRRTVTLEAINVEAHRELPGAFNERSRGRHLNIVTRDEIERKLGSAHHVGDLVREFPSIVILEDAKLPPDYMVQGVCIESTAGSRTGGALATDQLHCSPVQLMLDDVAVQPDMAKAIPLESLESVIFLKASEASSIYGFIGDHGLLLMYTRGHGPTVPQRH
jgi:protocatechuate 3,4-dioxygenase beta subunit